MSARDEALANGRAAAEDSMIDTCLITRTAITSTNEYTGLTHETVTTVYSGKCRVQQRGRAHRRERNAYSGDKLLFELDMELQLPMSATGIKTRDDVTMLTSRDPELVGRTFKVKGLAHKTDATARRLGIEEAT